MAHPIVLFTRFNLNMSFNKERSPNLDLPWLEERVRLFERWCHPSVINQNWRGFHWVVMLDPKTPREIVERLGSLEHVDARLMEDFSYPVLGRLAAHLASESEWVITANLDSDDMLHRSFMEDLAATCAQGRAFLVFPYGYTMSGERFYKQCYKVNQFRALQERTSDCLTVFSVDHDKIESAGSLKIINNEPRWASVIHGGNVANRVVGTRDIYACPSDFGIRASDRVSILDYVDVARTTMIEWARKLRRRS